MPKKMMPQDGESEVDFMDRCTMENDDNTCSDWWDESKSAKPVIQKTLARKSDGMEFILSDDTPDRYGDVIQADGWDIKNFSNNPIALFNHNPNFPIGKWSKLSVRGNALRGHLQLAPEGTSARIDEIRRLIDADILRAVSVGFRPIEHKPRDKNKSSGELYVKSELVETSLVSIPANPNALAIAKSLKISDDTINLVFGKHANGDGTEKRRGETGKHADRTKFVKKDGTMPSPIAQRIIDAEQRIVKLQDELDKHLAELNDENPEEGSSAIIEELNGKIDKQKALLKSLKDAETRMARTVNNDGGGTDITVVKDGSDVTTRNFRPFAMPVTKKITAGDHLWRSLTVAVKQHNEGYKRPILEVLKETYGENETSEVTRVLMRQLVTRAAAIPADTTTTGWATELVQTAMAEFMNALFPVSIYPQLKAKGGSFTFGTAGIVSIPSRDPTPTIAGSFVAQGAPIPVRQGSFNQVTLTPKKMAVISTMTREITEHSTPAIEGLIRQAILDDTAVAIDTILMDAGAATVVRPAGLRNGVSTLTPTGGGAVLAAVTGDLKLAVAALITSSNGNIRSPVWIMSPADVLSLSLIPATAGGGEFPFKTELAAGTLLGYPVIQSTTVGSDVFFLIDAADFVTATGDTPRFDVSDQAVLVMDDTAPAQVGVGGTMAAGGTRSLWQTDSIGIRMIMDLNWAMRRTGMVQYLTPVGWN